jgi:flagellar hook-associated protein FlgK
MTQPEPTTQLVRAIDTHTSQLDELTKILDRHSEEQVTALNRIADAILELAKAVADHEGGR